MTSAPFWAQLLCQFTINSIVTLFQIYLPSYFKDVLHLGVIANGTYTSIPNVVNFAVKLVWGISIDNLKEKNKISPTFAVKLSQAIANYGGTVCLILIALLVDCTNPTVGFALFCFMYGCMGTFVSGFYTSLLSLAPRYTATMSSISVFCAMLGRLSTPAIVGLIKKEGTLPEWQTLFFVLAAANAICGTVFLIFGSGDLQEWGIEEENKQSEMQPISAKQSLVAVNIQAPSIGNIAEQQAESVHFINAIGEDEDNEMVVPQILLNEITLTTEEAERFKRRIREDSMCL
ncbi:unnamed protein product [Caenorhabditis angaria]|uniref:Major facilitator superfamily (MFS) profile domain-containing protein n=1 Tax=Caenorhabditis angaria TaxID=860376 RepID=A0A9P1ITI3_9PELO|nr:unnamed protein product [Caenorhabditis angaria]